MHRLAYLAIAISNFFFISLQLLTAQQPVYGNLLGWQQLSSEHFDILYLPPNQSLARKAARYAEIALVEVGVAYDYKPQSRYSLYLLADKLQLPLTHVSLDALPGESGFFELDAEKKYVTYPGDSRHFYQAVKKEVADILLQEFTYGKRLRDLIQGQTILKQSLWYHQGMVEYLGEGWRYEDEMWLHSLSTDNIDQILDMALEGDGYLHSKLRKSIWRYITHEYGEQKVAEIIYFVNISNSIDAGIISVLGITLNTLTNRWRENLREVAASNSAGRYGLGKMTAKAALPIKKGYRLLQFAFSPITQQYAVYLDKGGLHELYTYDVSTQKYSNRILTSYFANRIIDGLEVQYPLSWSKDGKQLFTTVYQGKSYRMAWYDVVSEKVSFKPVPAKIGRILDADWAHHGRMLAVSALKGASPQIFTLPAQGSNFEAITTDYFDNVDPSWSFDDEYLFFSSNRDTIAVQPSAKLRDTRGLDFDIFSYSFSQQADTFTQLTRSTLIDERKPQAPNSFEVVYLTDETGIPNLKKVNIFLQQESYLTDLQTGLLTYQIFEDRLIFSTPLAAEAALFSVSVDSLPTVTIPELSLFRTEAIMAFQKQQKELAEIERLEDLVQAQESEIQQSPEKQKPLTSDSTQSQNTAEQPQEDTKKVRY